VDNTTPRQVNFKGVGGGPTGGGQFMIDDQAYQPADPGVVVKVNTAEQWQLQNFGGPDFPHPFHIHVNPFQIVGRTIDFEVNPADRKCPALDPNNPCNWMWADTAPIPAQMSKTTGPGQLNIRTRFLVFPGEYVIHCHILIHEDVGMMKNVTVQDDGTGVGPCQSLPTYTPAATACINRTTQPCTPPVCKAT
jgi:FtsP/CotA-like multicopper oxidase with cupredoxin domain